MACRDWVKQSPPTSTGQFRSPSTNMCQAARISLREPSKHRGKGVKQWREKTTSQEFNWRSNFNIFLVPSVVPHVHTGPRERLGGGGRGGGQMSMCPLA